MLEILYSLVDLFCHKCGNERVNTYLFQLPGKSHLQNDDRSFVKWDVKPYTLTHSILVSYIPT